jgi:hypothetical protein
MGRRSGATGWGRQKKAETEEDAYIVQEHPSPD